MIGKRRLNKGLSHSFAVLAWVYEKCLKMAVMQEHEALRGSGAIDRKDQTHLRKEAQNLRLDSVSVVGREKIMGGVYRAPPDFHDTRQVQIGRSSQFKHAPPFNGVHRALWPQAAARSPSLYTIISFVAVSFSSG